MDDTVETFHKLPGFCPDCGSVLPPLPQIGDVKCYSCSRSFSADAYGTERVTYTIHFHSLEGCEEDIKKENKQKSQQEPEGPTVDRKCAQCGNEKMSYATLQLRSADEGQTVFYTCTKCGFKESENS